MISPSFGFIIPQRGALFGLGTLRELLDFGREAEVSGLFDTLWVGDSLTSKSRPEAIACLGALAGSTESIRLAAGCMSSFVVRDPLLLALQWATLDQISEGRMLLAVSTGLQTGGASSREGMHFGGVQDVERVPRLEEHIDLCRKLWTGNLESFDGRFHSYDALQIEPIPVQSPCPIWIASNPKPGRYFDRAIQRVARLGDGWLTNFAGAEVFPRVQQQLMEALKKEGRDPAAFPTAFYHNINIGQSRSDCLADTKQFVDAYYGRAVPNDALLDERTVGGTPEECVDQLLQLAATGAHHIALRPTSFRQESQFRRLLEDVLPAVTSRLLTH